MKRASSRKHRAASKKAETVKVASDDVHPVMRHRTLCMLRDMTSAVVDNGLRYLQDLEKIVFIVAFDDLAVYTTYIKRITFNLSINGAYLMDRYPPNTLVLLDSNDLAWGTPEHGIKMKRIVRQQKFDALCKSFTRNTLLTEFAALLKCRKCKSTDLRVDLKQTRSADEPMTVFLGCRQCSSKWKF